MRVPMWAGWLTVAIIAALCYPLLPDDTLTARIYVNAVGLSSVAAMVVGILRNRPRHRGAWALFAAGALTSVCADIVYDVTELRLGEYPYPSWADALYLGAYPLLWASLSRLGRGQGDRERGGLIDAAIISTGIGLIFWVSVVGPTLEDAGSPLLERLVTIGYPLADILLTTAVARMLTRPENRTPSLRLLAIGSAILLTGDLVYTTMSSTAEYTGGIIDSGFLVAYACWGAAALHPSMRRRPDTHIDVQRIGRTRLAVLAAFTLIAPGLLFLQGATDPGGIAWMSLGVGAVVLFLLVVLRMWGLVQQVKAQASRLGDLAMHDELTGLANRRAFEQRLVEAAGAGSPTVLLLDLNGFKAVNDRFGHAVGDDLLAVVARRIAAELPPEAVAARMGGDEFAVMLPADGGDELAARLRSAIHRPAHVGGHDLLVGASVGIADGTEPVEVLRRADVAMYAAKADGGRQRRYSADLDDRTDEEARLGAELRTALDRGEFHLVYQPIVELPHGNVVAVESLVRWWHPERGYVRPDVFIPVAERTGLIVELGEWILRTACLQFADWWRRGVAPYRFGVNVSARQLAEPGFVDMVAAILAETGVHPARLIVEVTETAVFGGGAAVRAVHELNGLGIEIALDDFGTGHSSLGLLQTLPVSILKVDKSFIENVTMAGRHAVIATSLIQVANGLGLVAVAEGVETPEQAAELYRLGYRRAQGYHFGRPAMALPARTESHAA
ncbi:bifunctional diguanylate cyclase/phosphodiesterase [Actinoplanes sp. NEAU-A12]|uniref:Bifunctional diguanylate cyclase/phosphodiesterase n=1 Tax=Actinoplanes sandaracinus TaxID=3045177 RepID=A0ABT6WJY9_9ACTN|nr:bifunctional diguanylate cyclase/phosphodiesterase [Actinoplanes sandaracinus]MDI6100045.1 bifunctional diguanylate cyclase/phosphodiesterase [Actinoplanes sandaracinus]